VLDARTQRGARGFRAATRRVLRRQDSAHRSRPCRLPLCTAPRNYVAGAVEEGARDAPQQRPKKAQRSCVENWLSIKCQFTGQWSPGFVHDPHLRLRRPSGVDTLRISHRDTVCLRNPTARSILWCTYSASVDRQAGRLRSWKGLKSSGHRFSRRVAQQLHAASRITIKCSAAGD
jgi:hypothetical protein